MQPRHLSLQNIEKSFLGGHKELVVLHNVSQQFEAGTSYALIGASGSGKTTLLHILAGFEPTCQGTIEWGGTTLAKMSDEKKEAFMAKYLGFIFQFHYLINELTVLENVLVGSIIRGEASERARTRALALLERVGLTEKMDAHPQTLSGGQQQRVAVVRALLGQPAFLLADEPTGNLDHATGQEIIDLCQEYQREEGMGMVIATHDPQVYNRMDVVLRVQDGGLIQQ